MKTDHPIVTLSGYKIHPKVKNVIYLFILITTIAMPLNYFFKLPDAIAIIFSFLSMLGPFAATLLLCEITAMFEKTDDK